MAFLGARTGSSTVPTREAPTGKRTCSSSSVLQLARHHSAMIQIRPPPSVDWICKACNQPSNASTGVHLRICARCRIVHYCSAACQRRDFPSHKSQCIKLLVLQTQLRDTTTFFEMNHHSPGHFGDTPRTREHCENLSRIAFELDELSKKYYVVPLLEKVLQCRLEALRLDVDDQPFVCDFVPYTLLKLGREDQCVAFIKHWLQRFDTDSRPLTLHERSSRGDWLYGKARRFDDAFASLTMQPVQAHTSFLIALCMVKFRVLANDSERTCRVRQELLLERYLDAVHERNPIMLPAMINPEPLQNARMDDCSQPAPTYVAEAYMIMSLCFEMFVSVPGVVNWLVQRFGLTPQYRCEPFSLTIGSQ